MTKTPLLFENYARWAAWTSGVIAYNPLTKLGKLPSSLGGLAAESLAWIIFRKMSSRCVEGEFNYKIAEIKGGEHPNALAELENILQAQEFKVFLREEESFILWDHHGSLQPASPQMMVDMPVGVWAYWLTMSWSARPNPIFETARPGSLRGKLHDLRMVVIRAIDGAVAQAQTQESIELLPDLRRYCLSIEADLRLNGFEFDVRTDDGRKSFLIRIR